MTFIFNTGIPAVNNNPSVDQPDMLQNNVSTDGILAVDHISFNTNNGGNHLQVHFPVYSSPSVVNGSATQGSVLYGAAGTADAAHAQLYFKTAQNAGTFVLPVTCLRAWAFVSGGVGPGVIASQAVNVSSIVRNSTGVYTITLSTNAVSSANFAVQMNSSTSGGGATLANAVTSRGVGTFTVQFANISTGSFTDPTNFSFQVLQI